MLELSLSPVTSPSIPPISAITTAGTGDFAQVLADATGDAVSLLRPALAGALPPARQIPAAVALPIVDDDAPDRDVPLPSSDLAALIIVPRTAQDPKAVAVPVSAAEPASDAGTRADAADHVVQLPVVLKRSPVPISVAADRAATSPVALAGDRRVGKVADHPEPVERADAAERDVEPNALPPISFANVQPLARVPAETAPTPPAPTPTTDATSAAPPTVAATTTTQQAAVSAAIPTVPSPVSVPAPTSAIAPAAQPSRLPLETVAIQTVGSAVAQSTTGLSRPVAIELPAAKTPLRDAGAVPSVVSDVSNPAFVVGANRTVNVPLGVAIASPVPQSSVPRDIISITPGAPPAIAARPDARMTAAPAPASPPLIGVPVPALRAFAAAIAATNAPFTRQAREDESPLPSAALSAQPDATNRQTEVLTRSSPPIDMQREDWTRALIDRIDAVRDVANARDTRIALVPDALGKIEVALRQEGETLHVAFTADAPATRALLAEAQPRLAELAEARGLKLGDTAVSARSEPQGDRAAGGFGQSADQRRPTPAPQGTASNRSTTTNPASDQADSDNRIA